MSTLLLRLAGPLQSWGYRSRFSDRDTGLEPTKSGVVGLLCCALGRCRTQSPADLAELKMHVRVDLEGKLLTDFNTAGGGIFRGCREYFAPTHSGGKSKNPVVMEKHYLQDASFLVALEGDDTLLNELSRKLADPVWPLALGRRSCPPAQPVLEGLRPTDGATSLKNEPLRLSKWHLPRIWNDETGQMEPNLSPQRIRLVLECGEGDTLGEMRRDVPVSWPDTLAREYSVRFVRNEIIEKTPELLP